MNPNREKEPFGVIALAAYKPSTTSFLRQLKSIRDQTYRNYLCIISVDGAAPDMQALLGLAIDGDPRFTTIEHGGRVGFYRNFERALMSTPDGAEWIALADQDDYWYPDKLSILVPHLKAHNLVSGQARVVTPQRKVIQESTRRRNTELSELIVRNQVTGAMCVFRRDLLDVALPFPSNSTLELHDHWLGLCATATGSVKILDEIVQDYVQHGANALGEAPPVYSVTKYLRKVAILARENHGNTPLQRMTEIATDLTFGWARVMADALAERLENPNPKLDEALNAFATGHKWLPTARLFYDITRRRNVGRAFLFEFALGFPGALIHRNKR